MLIFVVGLSHHSAPIELRERLAFAEGALPDALNSLRSRGAADEAVILSTCNRVEIYAASSQEPRVSLAALRGFLQDFHQCNQPLGETVYGWGEPQSLQHLFRVACGLDSMVLGETEILGQLKRAYDLALQRGHTGARLNKAFQRAFNVAKQIRSTTNIQRGSVSVASVAVELAEKIFSSLSDRQVMVIGAGDTGEKAARALLSRGARSLLVANRTHERALALAAELGGRAVEFDQWAAEFNDVDVLISSTSARDYVLDRPKLAPLMKQRRHRPLLLIDIAVPRNIDPSVALMDDVYLYNIDDLQAIADQYLEQRKLEVARCEQIIREKVAALLGASSNQYAVFGDQYSVKAQRELLDTGT